MKGKKNWIWVLMALAICYAGSYTRVWAQEKNEQPEEIKLLQEKIEQLEKALESQQRRFNQLATTYNDIKKQLDEQIKENERLKALLPKDKISPTMPAKINFDPNNGIVYRGKQRNKQWFNMMYKKFHDKIAFVDSNYIDIGEEILDSPALQGIWVDDPRSEKRHMGVAPHDSKVFSVLANGEVLIHHEYENILHIRGVERNFVDGEPWPDGTPLIRNGTFNYTAANGQHWTVWSFVVYKPLTKEQFAEAINSGFELVEYKKMGEKTTIKTPIR